MHAVDFSFIMFVMMGLWADIANEEWLKLFISILYKYVQYIEIRKLGPRQEYD